MKTYQKAFIDFCLQHDMMKFGSFQLKSGRISPYFFNAGAFNTGHALQKIGHFYAELIVDTGLAFDVIFGPAYKGVPLAVAASVVLSGRLSKVIPYCFNRKTLAANDDGAELMGASLSQKKVLIVDDVLTAGTAIRQSIELLKRHQAVPVGAVVLLDRQERNHGQFSTAQEIEQEYQFPVYSLIHLSDLIEYLQGAPALKEYLPQIESYRKTYGV